MCWLRGRARLWRLFQRTENGIDRDGSGLFLSAPIPQVHASVKAVIQELFHKAGV